ncbi:hypothetical protein EDF57_10638 [Novosphingobium sp. PhB55]|nr:hypothetical protein EDF57_10638 [Novosphingobium sp. PhB55]
MVSFDHEGVGRRVASGFSGAFTSRSLRRAALAVRDAKVIERRSDMLVGWRRTLVGEKDETSATSSLTLTGFQPFCQADRMGFHKTPLGMIIYKHAIARLFERAIQPLEPVVSELLSQNFINYCSDVDEETAGLGFAIPFRGGRFLGSVESISEPNGAVFSIFTVHTWLPRAISELCWTDKPSRTLTKALRYDQNKRLLDLRRSQEISTALNSGQAGDATVNLLDKDWLAISRTKRLGRPR